MLRDLFIIEFNRVMNGTYRDFEYRDVFMGITPMMYMINSNGLIDGGQYLYEYRENIVPYRLLCRRIFETPTGAINFLEEMCDSLSIESQFCIIRAIKHCIAELETIKYRTDTNFSRIDYSIDIEQPGTGNITLQEMHTDYRKIKRIIYDEDSAESTNTEDDGTSRWVHKNNYQDMNGDVCETCYCDNCKKIIHRENALLP